MMVLSDKCTSAEGAAQKLVGEASGVVQLGRQQADKYIAFTDLLMIITCSCYMCKQSFSNA